MLRKRKNNILSKIVALQLLFGVFFTPFFYVQGASPIIPKIISRAQWGANESEMNWQAEYAKVEKLVVHHTASSNLVPDSDKSGEYKSMVNNIYTYHNSKRTWYDNGKKYIGFGDIGYNYLIDPNGNIYEGRAGGNGAIGGHVSGFNTGTVGISILGSYGGNVNNSYLSHPLNSKIENSLENLVGWIASNNNIKLNRSSNFNGKNVDGLIGHRDLAPTNCPGDDLYSRLDIIQNNAEIIRKTFDKYVYQIGGDRAIYTIENGYKTKFNSASSLPSVYASKTIIPITKSQLDFYKYKDLIIYPDESLLQEFNTSRVYYIQNGKKRPMEMSGEEFGKMGYKTSDIIKVFSSDLKLYESGKIIKYSPDDQLIRDNKGNVYLSESGKKRRFTSPKLFEYLNYKWEDIKDDQFVSFYLDGSDVIYPNKTLIKKEDSHQVYYIEDKMRRRITSLTLMKILGFNFDNVIVINNDEFDHFPEGRTMKYPDGSLVRSVDVPSIYLIKDGKKKEFTSAVLFETAGYKWNDVIEIDTSEINQYPNDGRVLYPDGFLIRSKDAPEIYFLESGKRRKITSIALFENLGYKWNNVVLINPDEIKDYPIGKDMTYPDGTLVKRDGFPIIFRIENGKRKEFTSITLFEAINSKWSDIISLSKDEFLSYQLDGFVKYQENTLLREINTEKVYVVKDGSLQEIRSVEEFTSANYRWSDIIDISKSEINLYLKPKIVTRKPVSSVVPLQEKEESIDISNDVEIEDKDIIVNNVNKDSPNIRIAIYSTTSEDVIVSANGNYTVNYYNSDGIIERTENRSADEQTVIKYFDSSSYVKIKPESESVIIKVVSYDDLSWDKTINDNEFRGSIEINHSEVSNKLWIINDLLLEDYVNGIAEALNDSPEEYLMAFGTIARTYAMYYIEREGKHSGESFHLKNSRNGNGNDQVYKGYNFEIRAPEIVAANNETAGYIINYNDKPIVAAYSSDSGGTTKNACDVLSKAYCSNDYAYLHGGITDPVNTQHNQEKVSASHGAGMSATGAYQMSLDGNGWQDIIKYYYPGIEISKYY
ncbi:MAG: N-acetylmuramoyl-L-alanine amidase [Candidatus Pacebacteria bacterium]|nr:N-acetylmuramoyl-L-alanine amidase [Candidatus Paceibacterota bacterium]